MTPAELKERRIGVLMGGRSSEREISLQSGEAVLEALKARGYDAVGLDVGLDVCAQLSQREIEVAFIALHGRYGEDGCIQGLLESLEIPYTGAGVLASAMAMDKVVAKRLFEIQDIPTPPWALARSGEAAEAIALGFPLVVKPRAEGSSVGLKIVADEAALNAHLLQLGEETLVEAYITGREFSVAVIGEGKAARVLGNVEIRAAAGLYDYEAKYQRDDTEYLVPAPVSADISEAMGEFALKAHRLLQCTGATRSDFRYAGDGAPLLLEINTLPGLTSHSLLPKIAVHTGLSYEGLVEDIACQAAVKA
jgi:D-alanine-D-alanine ligase